MLKQMNGITTIIRSTTGITSTGIIIITGTGITIEATGVSDMVSTSLYVSASVPSAFSMGRQVRALVMMPDSGSAVTRLHERLRCNPIATSGKVSSKGKEKPAAKTTLFSGDRLLLWLR